MKKIFIIFICCCIAAATSIAQQVKVSLQVRDAQGGASANITLQVYGIEDSVLISKVIASGGTSFSLAPHHGYTLQLSGAGISPENKILMLGGNDTAVVITVKPQSKELNNVVITARKPLIKQEDDKMIVDAELLANSSSNAYEVLEKTPGAVVDQDGNVYLNSANPAQIQINGKEVKLSTADVASLLKSLPANSVVKIEVLRNPSAKYDAGSSGGIINIVLKKGIKIGASGSANVSWFQGRFNTKSAGFNLNNSDGRRSSYFSYQFTDRNNFEELGSNRFFADTLIAQKAYTRYPATNHYIGGGTEYELSKKWSIGYDVRYTNTSNNTRAINAVNFITVPTQLLTQQTNSTITNNGRATYLGNSVNTKYRIDSAGSEFTASVDYDVFKNNNLQAYNNQYTTPVLFFNGGDGTVHNNKNIFVAEADLLLKIKPGYNIETGAKYIGSNSSNNAQYFLDTGINRKADPVQTNRFKYREHIASAYLQISKTFSGFTLKPGLRVERTDIDGHQLYPTDTTLAIRRTDFFPYVYLRQTLAKMFGFTLSGNAIYRRSITRPYYEALNPYPQYVDQYLYNVGNPRLQPQFTTNYEFNISADQFPVFSVGLNDIKDIFTNVTYQDSTTKIAYRTYDNLGRNKEVYLRAVGGIPPGKKYFFYAGAQYNHVNYSGYYQGATLQYKRGTWTFFMYHNYKPAPTFNIGVNAFMRLRGLQNFYELKSFGQLNITANQAILQKKMNIILSVNDLLRTNKYSFALDQAGVLANGTRLNDSRRVGLTLRYNFGIKPKEEKKELFETPKEAVNN